MRKRLASVLIGMAVIGVVAVSLASDHPDTVPIERHAASPAVDCSCGGTVDGCSDDCGDCEAAGGCGSDSCDCDSDSDCDTDSDCGGDSQAGAHGSDDPLRSGCGGCR